MNAGHEEEMPATPAEFLAFYLMEEFGLTTKQAVAVWFELEEYAHRMALLNNSQADFLGIAFDGHGGKFIGITPETSE